MCQLWSSPSDLRHNVYREDYMRLYNYAVTLQWSWAFVKLLWEITSSVCLSRGNSLLSIVMSGWGCSKERFIDLYRGCSAFIKFYIYGLILPEYLLSSWSLQFVKRRNVHNLSNTNCPAEGQGKPGFSIMRLVREDTCPLSEMQDLSFQLSHVTNDKLCCYGTVHGWVGKLHSFDFSLEPTRLSKG